ncbi:SRPBCC family protein [Kribbella sp. NBC_01505]|uniref:SRPBCC family protein n=1 Tax=Kribbella sp. NBC_01505 TaxID=2903580 RepID=UPI00386B00EA
MSITALIAAPLAAASILAGPVPAPTRAPAPLTCQGQTVDRTAKISYRNEIFIKAPVSKVWKVQTDVAKWTRWQQPVASAERLDHGPLRAGSAFRWTTPVEATPYTPKTTLVITSTVHQAKHNQCLRWSGPAIGEGLTIDRGVHVWNFEKVHGGTIVRTEETWTGPQVEAMPDLSRQFLGQGLDAWLLDLKTQSEKGC